MSTNHLLFGWVSESALTALHPVNADALGRRVGEGQDNLGRRQTKYEYVDPSLSHDGFDTSFILNIYDPEYSIFLQSGKEYSERQWRPFTLTFAALDRGALATSLPLLERLKVICTHLQPELLFSMNLETFYEPELTYTPETWSLGFPSPNAAGAYSRGLLAFSQRLGLSERVQTEEGIYRQVSYPGGVITLSPLGCYPSSEKPYLFADRDGNVYSDGVLEWLLLDRYDNHVAAVKRVTSSMHFSGVVRSTS